MIPKCGHIEDVILNHQRYLFLENSLFISCVFDYERAESTNLSHPNLTL